MKNVVKVMAIAFCALSLGFVSCSDDDDDLGPAGATEEEPVIVGDAIDVTDGMNVIILEGDDQIRSGFRLKTKGMIVGISNMNPSVSYKQCKYDENVYIKPTIDSGSTSLIYCDQVHLADGQGYDKTITVVLRKSATKEISNLNSGTTPAIAERFLDVLGKGFDIDMPRGITESNVFSTDHIAMINDQLHGGLLSLQSTNQSEELKFEEGRTYNSITRSWSENVGLNISFPAKGFIFSLGLSEHVSKSEHTESTREYAFAQHNAIKAQGAINELALAGFCSSGYLTGSSINKWSPIIAVELNNALNNPSSAEYKMYGNDEAGINRLISTYGGWFFTACQLGGAETILYSKKVDASCNSFAWSMAVDFGMKKEEDAVQHEENILKQFLIQMMKKELVKAHFDYERSGEDIKEKMEMHSEESCYGGTMDSNGKWEVSKDPHQWTIMAYGTPNDVEKVKHGEKNPHLHLLYELCVDQNSERAKALKRALEPGENDMIPYLKYKQVYSEVDKGRMVLADVILVDRTSGSTGSVQKDDEKVEYWKSPDGKWRYYYPMVANGNAGFSKWGFAPSYNDYYWSGESTNTTRQYIYYALDWSTECRGITNIRLGTKADARTESIRGCSTDRGMKHSANHGSRYIIVEWAEEDTPVDQLITGFGMKYTDWDGDNGTLKGKVFSSTGGTDWEKDTRFRREDKYEQYFLKYWTEGQYVKCEENDKKLPGKSDQYQNSFVDLQDCHRGHTAHMCYTRKPIERDMTGFEGMDPEKAYTGLERKSAICLPWQWTVDPYIN